MPRSALLIAPVLLLVGCQSLTSTTAAPARTHTYTCDDGRIVQAVYPDADTAVLTLDRHTYRLHIAISADGARYVGDHWQWWAKGMRQARLSPLKPGETYASANGVDCLVR